ncbi:uncharacterized protein LOC111640427 [Centruroides sculpturatus]|uniref:uncharacterized protein LOC111640427 n=2 Tax=Centruroides sculpturatus TaxID=218467 RepID=UPI000C6CCAA3|nr:uncharacterized protein LOC111640427 [Centruroides sculpturatus]
MSWLVTFISASSILAIVTVSTTSTETSCSFDEFRQCLQALHSLTQSNDLVFGTTKEDLVKVCSDMQESISCVDEYIKRCFTATQAQVFNHVVAEARQVKDDLCVPGPIQEAYLRHAPCFINISLSEDKCAPIYRHVLELSENVNKEEDVEEGLRKSCCAFNEFVLCKYHHVSKDCGSDAAEFQQKHLDRISGPLMYEHCATYTFGSNTCSSSDQIKPIVRMLALIYICLKLWM